MKSYILERCARVTSWLMKMEHLLFLCRLRRFIMGKERLLTMDGETFGVKYQTKTVLQYTTKLVLMGLLYPTATLPNDPNRNTSQRMERNENGEIIVFM